VAVADPRLVPGARLLSRISCRAMRELARFGAKVVHPRALVGGPKGVVPIVVRSTFSQASGTLVADVDDEAPVVGLALLPPMETVTLPPRSVAAATRDTWEDQRLVMSLADTCSGYVFVGAADDKRDELMAAVRENGVEPVRAEGRCGWVSVVGDGTALRQGHVRWLTRLAEAEIKVRGFEIAAQRITYLVSEADRTHTAQTLYEATGLAIAPA
jgi:aspartate kinase